MPGDEYLSVPNTGKLKLKGISDGRVDKKKKKKKKPGSEEAPDAERSKEQSGSALDFKDNSVVLKSLEDEDHAITKSQREETVKTSETAVVVDGEEDVKTHLQTEAERKFDEQRRKRLEERLKREGVKTHKQRVEELNRYLSSLSEHNDMPRVGPG